jgi:predicted PurR-regulated permease PerM
LISGACLVILIAGMQTAAPSLVPFLMAAFVASVCLPPMQWLMDRKVPATAAVFIIILGLGAEAGRHASLCATDDDREDRT